MITVILSFSIALQIATLAMYVRALSIWAGRTATAETSAIESKEKLNTVAKQLALSSMVNARLAHDKKELRRRLKNATPYR